MPSNCPTVDSRQQSATPGGAANRPRRRCCSARKSIAFYARSVASRRAPERRAGPCSGPPSGVSRGESGQDSRRRSWRPSTPSHTSESAAAPSVRRVDRRARERTRTGTDVAGLLQPDVLGVLLLEETAQVVGEREHARLVVLRRVGVEADFVADEIDLPPFERQHFGVDPPAGDIRELDHRLQRRRSSGPCALRSDRRGRLFHDGGLDVAGVGDVLYRVRDRPRITACPDCGVYTASE